MNGYRLPIHKNTMKSITKSRRVSPRFPSRQTKRQGRDENAIGNKSSKHMTIMPPSEKHDETERRDDRTRRERGQIKQAQDADE